MKSPDGFDTPAHIKAVRKINVTSRFECDNLHWTLSEQLTSFDAISWLIPNGCKTNCDDSTQEAAILDDLRAAQGELHAWGRANQ